MQPLVLATALTLGALGWPAWVARRVMERISARMHGE